MKRRAFTVMAILLVFWSCSENSFLFGPEDELAQVEVHTLSAGELVQSRSEIPVSITRDRVYTGDPESADRLLVELLDHEDTVLAEQSYGSVDQAVNLPPVSLPELADGLYRLRTSYFDGSTLVATDSTPFFIVSGHYRIVGLTSYPASSYPEADGLLRLSLDVPPASDPYLVWKINDTVVESGHLSETGATIAVLAPAAQGVFPVRVELYPFMPEGVDIASVPAPTDYTAELYVSNSPAPGRTDLVPRDSYFALYHLRGTLRDDGIRSDWFPARDFTAEPFGTPRLTVRAGVFGYALDGVSGFRMAGSVWPAHDNELSPISISFRLVPDVLPAESVLMDLTLGATSLATMLVDEAGRVGLRFASASQELWSAVSMLEPGVSELITVSIVPGDESSRVSFFANGELVSAVETSVATLESLAGARLVAGADRWALLEGVTT
ncbi:MAG: hypothetical protein ACOC2Q_05430, partial [Spirochaetota bacterium]